MILYILLNFRKFDNKLSNNKKVVQLSEILNLETQMLMEKLFLQNNQLTKHLYFKKGNRVSESSVSDYQFNYLSLL